MTEQKLPCVTYARSRYAERRASSYASEEQLYCECRLATEGFEIVGRYGDAEFAPPYCGWLEPRLSWSMACDEAVRIAHERGSCTLIIVQHDGIGTGDQFLPTAFELEGVDIRVCDSSPSGEMLLTSLEDANDHFERHKARERARSSAVPFVPLEHRCRSELYFHRDPRRRQTRAYYCNPSDQPLKLRWQAYTRSLSAPCEWSPMPDWATLEIPPRSAAYLETFFQGEACGEATWWRFKIGEGPDTWVSNVMVTPWDMTQGTPRLNWYPYSPQELRTTDFHWQGRPCLQTARMLIRNWQPEDHAEYEKHCNTDEVMRFLGGRQTAAEVQEDLEYFAMLGDRGPTFWAVERMQDGALLGFCGVIEVEEADSPVHGQMEIGWRFRRDCWGEGYASEAAAEVLHALFEEIGRDGPVIARIDPRNGASVSLAKRLGMRENETRRHATGDGNQVLHVYEMDRQRYWGLPPTSGPCVPNPSPRKRKDL